MAVTHNYIGKPAGGNASQGHGEAYALDGCSKNGCRKLNKKFDSPFCPGFSINQRFFIFSYELPEYSVRFRGDKQYNPHFF